MKDSAFTTTVVISLPVAVTVLVGSGPKIKILEAEAAAPFVSIQEVHDMLEEQCPGTVAALYWSAKHRNADGQRVA